MKTFNPKLQTLCELEGYSDIFEMLEEATIDSIAPGICVNPNCDYTIEVEPDCREGFCEECQTQTVKSCLVLAGFM